MDEHEDAPASDEALSSLGGRLALLPPDRLDDAQRAVYDALIASRVAHAAREGYTAALPDGRLVGPFNALLRVPAIAARQLSWAGAIADALAATVPRSVSEIAVLTVGSRYGADYVVHAHGIAAANAGVDPDAIADVVAGRTPTGLSGEEVLVHRLAVALVQERHVGDDLYTELTTTLGETAVVTLTVLIGQYLGTCALLSCFAVPDPTRVA